MPLIWDLWGLGSRWKSCFKCARGSALGPCLLLLWHNVAGGSEVLV